MVHGLTGRKDYHQFSPREFVRMKPSETWSFSCVLRDVDLPRIVKETGLYRDGGVVLVTIDGKPYTLWRDVDFPGVVRGAAAGAIRYLAGNHVRTLLDVVETAVEIYR